MMAPVPVFRVVASFGGKPVHFPDTRWTVTAFWRAISAIRAGMHDVRIEVVARHEIELGHERCDAAEVRS